VTGGIGSGKSEALRAFEALGAAVLSADEVVHRLYLDPDVVAAVVKRFGAEVAPGGVVDRGRLGPAAFADADGLRALEALLHPRVERARQEWAREMLRRDPPPPLLVCEVPLLFEVGLQDTFDAALVVTASEAVRRVRVEGRGQSFNERRDRQIPEAEKVRMASAAFTNDGSVEELEAWVADRFAEYRR
jgi:dephospho-CoA kinase